MGKLDVVKRHARRAAVVGGGRAFAAAGALVGARLLTEAVPPSTFGDYKLALALSSLATGLFIRPAVQFLMREYHDAATTSGLAAFLAGAQKLLLKSSSRLSLVLAALGTGLATWLEVPRTMVLLACALFFVSSLLELRKAFLITGDAQKQATSLAIAQAWLVPVTIFALANVVQPSTNMMLALTAGVTLSLFIVYAPTVARLAKQTTAGSIWRPDSRFWQRGREFCVPLVSVGLLGWLVHESDRFFLARFMNSEAVGLYSAAYGVVSAPFTVAVGSFAQLLYPVMFRASTKGDRAQQTRVVVTMLGASFALCAVGLGVVFLFGEQIAWLALASEYRRGAQPLMLWISAGYGIHAMATVFDLAAYGRRSTRDMLFAYGISALVNVSLNFLLIPKQGAKGAVLATFFALLAYFIVMSSLFLRRTHRSTT